MAYGQTGTGKTHTMLGPHQDEDATDDAEAVGIAEDAGLPIRALTSENAGIIPRGLKDIFTQVHSDTSAVFTITASYVQIYCELIHDLLAEDEYAAQRRLNIREVRPFQRPSASCSKLVDF